MTEDGYPETSIERPAKRARLSTAGAETAKMEEASDLQKELKAGITAYVSPKVQGFSGILKQRYTDFLVNEILPDGRVLHLEKDALPKIDQQKEEQSEAVKSGQVSEATDASTGEQQEASAVNSAAEARSQEETAPSNTAAENGTSPRVSQSTDVKVSTNSSQMEEATQDNDPQISNEDITKLESLFGADTARSITKLYSSVLKHPAWRRRDFTAVVSAPISDKEARTDAHQTIRRIFSSKLESSTAEDNCMRITAATQTNQHARSRAVPGQGQTRGHGRLGWQELGGEYLHFTLYKENKDTMEVIYYLASQLKIPTKSFQFAGTKDRRAVTVQRVSVFRTQAQRLKGLNRGLRNARVGGFTYENDGLRLGELRGNEFTIILRDCHFAGEEDSNVASGIEQRFEHASAIVGAAVQNLKEKGFINYYGLQRFGSFATSTDDIGKALLRGAFHQAIHLILHQSPAALAAAKAEDSDKNETAVSSDDRRRALALEKWFNEYDANGALAIMPRKFSAETSIIRHLGTKRNGKLTSLTDYQGALLGIQRNLRLMYVHAYQSLVWNTVAGRRWEKFGDKVAEGDLVIVETGHKGGTAAGKKQEVDADGEPIIRPEADDRAIVEDDYERARPLTAEEASSGRYSIFDIVLPLPGFDVVYPANEIGEFYKEFMESEAGGGLDPMDMRRKVKDFSLSGGYRKLLARPEGTVGWEVKVYEGLNEQLVDTDLIRVKGKDSVNGAWPKNEGADKPGIEKSAMENEHNNKADAGNAGDEKDTKETSKAQQNTSQRLAVILRLQLGSSTYATMALRELMKAGVKSYKPDFGMGRD